MRTDKELLAAMLTRAGIVFYLIQPITEPNIAAIINIEAQNGPKNRGHYSGYALLYFNADESLDAISIAK